VFIISSRRDALFFDFSSHELRFIIREQKIFLGRRKASNVLILHRDFEAKTEEVAKRRGKIMSYAVIRA
jgi:hypothetical protein